MRSFNQVYEEIYKSNHDELEKMRKDRANKTVILIAVTILAIFLITRIFAQKTVFYVPFEWMVMLSIMLVVIISSVNKAKFTKIFKPKVIEPFVKNVDPNLNYYANKGIMSALYRRGEFERYDLYSSEDYENLLEDQKTYIKTLARKDLLKRKKILEKGEI